MGMTCRLGSAWYYSAMTFDGNNVHILGLSPAEQFALRLLMTNLMAGYIDKSVGEAAATSNMEASDNASRRATVLFLRFCDFIDMLCPESMLGKAKPKVLMVKPELMKYVALAANGWDPYNNYLDGEQRQVVNNLFDGINKKVAESLNHTYNRWEIEKEKNRK